MSDLKTDGRATAPSHREPGLIGQPRSRLSSSRRLRQWQLSRAVACERLRRPSPGCGRSVGSIRRFPQSGGCGPAV